MDWQNERWVKLYTRDSADWLALSWQAQGLFCLILRKVNRAGVIDLGRHAAKGLAAHFGGPAAWASIKPHLDELVEDGCVVIDGTSLVVPRFVEAQEATQSAIARKRTERERERDGVTKRDPASRNVTKSHEKSHDVTDGHAMSRDVTNRTDQNRSDESRESDARAPEARCPTVEPATTSTTDPAEVLASMRAASSGLVADPTTTSAGELVAVKRAVDALLSRGVALDVIVRGAAHLAHGHWTQRTKRSVITAGRLVEERDGRGSILGDLLADADGCIECRPAKMRQTPSAVRAEPVNAPPPVPAKPTPAGLRIAALAASLRAEREAEERAGAEAKAIA